MVKHLFSIVLPLLLMACVSQPSDTQLLLMIEAKASPDKIYRSFDKRDLDWVLDRLYHVYTVKQKTGDVEYLHALHRVGRYVVDLNPENAFRLRGWILMDRDYSVRFSAVPYFPVKSHVLTMDVLSKVTQEFKLKHAAREQNMYLTNDALDDAFSTMRWWCEAHQYNRFADQWYVQLLTHYQTLTSLLPIESSVTVSWQRNGFLKLQDKARQVETLCSFSLSVSK